jgi:hypothetical protein
MSLMRSRLGWLLACVVGGFALGAGAAGCGGSSPTLHGPGDGGSEAASEAAIGESEGGDATMTGPDAGEAAAPGDDSGDSTTTSGDDAGETGTPGTDGGDSATPMDTGTGTTESGADASDAGTASDAADGATSCGADNTACTNAGTNGLCETNVCSSCVDTTDDAHCSAAYGDGGSAGYLCLAGTCSPGNCRTDADCTQAGAGGPLCGVTTANLCGKCTSDSECAGNSSGAFCNTTTGACVAGTCTGTGANPPVVCAFNTADICCTTACQPGAPAGAKSCCPGTAGDTYCAGQLGGSATCANGTCSSCAAGPSNAYTVDPVHGSDTAGNGNGTPATCAFATITRALQVIGNGAAFAITVTVIGPATVATGETFPISVPQNVSIVTSGGAITVNVPQGRAGFVLNAPNASVAGSAAAPLTVSGQGNKANFGVTASSANSTGTSISNLTLASFGTAGILVQNGGVLSIGAGVTSTGNPDGLHVTNTGQVTISVPPGAATHFDTNTVHGILVDANGSIALTGAVTSAAVPPTGTVTTNHNTAAGIWVEQTPGSAAQNTITGLVSYANAGNGIRFVGGSNVKLRASVSLGNAASGVIVSAGMGAAAAANDIGNIDLGDPADAGGSLGENTVQAPLGNGENGNAGICLAMRANAGTLLAAGNAFATANCATTAGAVTLNDKGCGNVAACTGNVCDIGYSGAGNDIDVSLCTHP